MANDFLTFAGDPAANVMLQADYAATGFTARILGFSTGTALSIQLNKVWRQASLISTMIANFTVTETGSNMLDDGSPAGMTALQNNFAAAIRTVAQGAVGTGYLPLVGGTLTGPLIIQSANALDIKAPVGSPATLALDSAAGQYCQVFSRTNGTVRWSILHADNAPETGGNAGSNWSLSRYSDAGNYLGTPLSISRATGVVNFTNPPTLNGAPLPYLSIGGGNLSGQIWFTGGAGITYALGSYSHAIEYGWDGSEILAWVDATYVGNLATQQWSNSVLTGYLPLSGGTLTGALQCNASLVVNGGAGFRSSVWFANLGDFANFTDGRYRYRQWAGNWFDNWDGQTGNRTWYCAGGQSMRLDGGAALTTTGMIRTESARLMVQHGSVAPCVGLWAQWAGAAMGSWFDGNALWFGGVDGNANPVSGLMDIALSGAVGIANTLWVGGQISAGGLIYSNSYIQAAGDVDAGNNLNVNGNGYIRGLLEVDNIQHTYGSGKNVNHSTLPCFAMDFVGNYAMGISLGVLSAAMTFGYTDAGGQPQGWMGFLNTAGVWGGAYFQTLSGRAIKKNIEPSRDFDSLSAIRQVETFSYDMKDSDTHRDFGFIAEELADLLPDVVSNYEAGPTVDVTALIAHAYRAIAQLARRIDAI